MHATGQTSYYSLPPRDCDYFTNVCGQPYSPQIRWNVSQFGEWSAGLQVPGYSRMLTPSRHAAARPTSPPLSITLENGRERGQPLKGIRRASRPPDLTPTRSSGLVPGRSEPFRRVSSRVGQKTEPGTD